MIEDRIASGLLVIQGVATGVVIIMAVIAACIVAAKKFPSIDEQGVKSQLISAELSILGITALLAAMIWGVPWIWDLFVGL